jgi:5-methylcytosine-specific restriction endonuclease McrA
MNKFCKRCKCESKRYADGRCITCTLARNAAWAKRNPEVINKISRARNARNPEKKRALNAVYREAKHEEILHKRKVQRQKDPSIDRIKRARRRALKHGNGGLLSKNIAQQLLERQNGLCACCQKPLNGVFHLDHIMPLSLGGKNADENVQLLLPKCNLQKFTSTPEKFMLRRVAEQLQGKNPCATVE